MQTLAKGQFWKCRADGLLHRVLEIDAEHGVCTWSEVVPDTILKNVHVAGFSWLGPVADFLGQFIFVK